MTKVKICGLTTLEHVLVAEKAGADYIGFVFAKSKRKIEPEEVALITRDLPVKIKKVGVFVSPSVNELIKTIEIAGLNVIQLHGSLNDELKENLANSFFKESDVEVIQAFSGQQENIAEAIKESHADYILLDAPAETAEYAGGNGLTFNWEDTLEKIKELQHKKIFIAGGLSSNNVKKAIHVFQPFGVDVSSSVETNEKKDTEKIKAFIQAVREEQDV